LAKVLFFGFVRGRLSSLPRHDFVGSQNQRIFFGKGFGKSSLQLVSKSLNQFRFGLSKLAFGYLVFW
jgi:hypothetical protein